MLSRNLYKRATSRPLHRKRVVAHTELYTFIPYTQLHTFYTIMQRTPACRGGHSAPLVQNVFLCICFAAWMFSPSTSVQSLLSITMTRQWRKRPLAPSPAGGLPEGGTAIGGGFAPENSISIHDEASCSYDLPRNWRISFSKGLTP